MLSRRLALCLHVEVLEIATFAVLIPVVRLGWVLCVLSLDR